MVRPQGLRAQIATAAHVVFWALLMCVGTPPAHATVPTQEPRIVLARVDVDHAVDLGNAFAAVAAAVRPTVVYIRTETLRGRGNAPDEFDRYGRPRARRQPMVGTGTGFIVRANGYVVTNHHVVHDARRVFVRLFDEREFEAEIVGADPLTDLAVLRVPADDLPVAIMGNSEAVRVGEWVLAIGNPLGTALTFSVTAGIVSATGRSLYDPADPEHVAIDFIQTDAVANRGNSGGPLIDLRGRIVGLNAVIASESGYYQGYTLAIPSSLVAPVVARLIRHGRVIRAGLGIAAADVSREDAEVVGLATPSGAVIQDVVDDGWSRSGSAGLHPGDVVTAVNGQPVTSAAELYRRTWFRYPGDTVFLSVHREGGRQFVIPARLGPVHVRTHTERQLAPVRADPCVQSALEVCYVAVSEDDARRRGWGNEAIGLEVTAVYSLGPSHDRLFPGLDIVTHVNGHRVRTGDEMLRALAHVEPGSIVTIRTYRAAARRASLTRIRVRGQDRGSRPRK